MAFTHKNSKGDTVGYLANNGNAQYIRAQLGALATSGRNILRSNGINNWDFNIVKNISFNERMKLQVRGDFLNGFNHSQFTPGQVNTVNLTNRANITSFMVPGNPVFGRFDQVWSNNARLIQLAGRFTF